MTSSAMLHPGDLDQSSNRYGGPSKQSSKACIGQESHRLCCHWLQSSSIGCGGLIASALASECMRPCSSHFMTWHPKPISKTQGIESCWICSLAACFAQACSQYGDGKKSSLCGPNESAGLNVVCDLNFSLFKHSIRSHDAACY